MIGIGVPITVEVIKYDRTRRAIAVIPERSCREAKIPHVESDAAAMFCRINPCWSLDATVASGLSEMEIKVAVIVKIVQG